MPSVPNIPMDDEALTRTENGRFHIHPLVIVDGEMDFGKYKQKTRRMICQSAYMNKEGRVSICKNPCFTVVGEGSGDQTQIIECGKCRTQYVIRRQHNTQGDTLFSTAVWAIGRKIGEKGKLWTDRKDWSDHIIFGTEKNKTK